MTTAKELLPTRDWVCDFHRENGNYTNRCNICENHFQGLKGRMICFACSITKNKNAPADMEAMAKELSHACISSSSEGCEKQFGTLCGCCEQRQAILTALRTAQASAVKPTVAPESLEGMRSAEEWRLVWLRDVEPRDKTVQDFLNFIKQVQTNALASQSEHINRIDSEHHEMWVALGKETEKLRVMREALEKAAKTFRWYEELHAAKPDMEKATRNAEFAEMCELALADKE